MQNKDPATSGSGRSTLLKKTRSELPTNLKTLRYIEARSSAS